MTLLSTVLTAWLAAAPSERAAIVVQAPDSPVRIDRASVLQGADGPPVILYSATNPTDTPIDEFTVMAFVFDANGALKARQTAPGRRTLDARGPKFTTMVLDGSPIDATYQIVIGLHQA